MYMLKKFSRSVIFSIPFRSLLFISVIFICSCPIDYVTSLATSTDAVLTNLNYHCLMIQLIHLTYLTHQNSFLSQLQHHLCHCCYYLGFLRLSMLFSFCLKLGQTAVQLSHQSNSLRIRFYYDMLQSLYLNYLHNYKDNY